MTSNEIQELRDWAARKMGWIPPNQILPGKWVLEYAPYTHKPLHWIHESGATITDKEFADSMFWIDQNGKYVTQWQPDRPETGQIWLVVDRMRELGFALYLEIPDKDYGIPYWPINHIVADFQKSLGLERPKSYEASDINPCLAILKAARATEE